MRAAVRCAIYPSIGLARLGNSDEWFVGPEVPGSGPRPPGGTFKDHAGRVKRQAARFRIYAFDGDGRVLGEVTAANATITWTVHLANKKASFLQFKGRYVENPPLRNPQTQPELPPDQRNTLIIDPGPRQVSGVNRSGAEYRFDAGSIGPLTVEPPLSEQGPVSTARVLVPLGELRTDELGRLLLLAAPGMSGSVLPDRPVTDYANNDYWYDDTADGPISAQVTLHDGHALEVSGRAWCLCVPPHFATDLTCLTTLWDQMEEVAGLDPRPTLSFRDDLWPIFSRVANYQWSNASALIGHGPQGRANFADPATASRLADNSAANRDFRERIFMRVRDPGLVPTHRVQPGERYLEPASDQADGYYMPAMCGDYGENGPIQGDPTTWLTVIASQYDRLRRWRDGDFADDWPRGSNGALAMPSASVEDVPLARQPEALTRAALERTVGAPFFPGIEMTYIVRDPHMYAEPFRFADHLGAGDITRWMAVPWQADFFECNTYWWPSARPDDVIPATTYVAETLARAGRPGFLLTPDAVHALRATIPDDVLSALAPLVDVPITSSDDASWAIGQLAGAPARDRYGAPLLQAMRCIDFHEALGRRHLRRQWARGLGGPQDSPAGDNRMVNNWHELGFVVPVTAPNGQVVHVETERASSLSDTPVGPRGRGGRHVGTSHADH